MRARPAQLLFNGGEFTPRLEYRADLTAFQAGASEILNGYCLPEGGVIRRGGSIVIASTKHSDKDARLITFAKAFGDRVVIEAGDLYLRFFDAETQTPLIDGGSPYEVTTPWAQGDVPSLYTWQSVNVMWFSHRSGVDPVYVLKRYDENDWQLDKFRIDLGPWLPMNGDDAHTMTASVDTIGATGTLTSSKPLFTAGHVGALFRLFENLGNPPYKTWHAEDGSLDPGQYRTYGGRVYKAVAGTDTGTTPPVHEAGIVSDGAAEFEFIHDGAGVVEITAVANSTTASIVVRERLPGTGPTPYWAEGCFSPERGYPRIGGIVEERLVLASTLNEPDTIYLSRTLEYSPISASFKPGAGSGEVVDTDAIKRTVADGQVNLLSWIFVDEMMMIGGPQAVKRVTGPSVDESLSPAGMVSRKLKESLGVHASVPPVYAGGALIYPDPSGRVLLEDLLNNEEPRDLLARAEHVGEAEFGDLAWVSAPRRRLYVRRKDGALWCGTYYRAQEIMAWTRIVLGGTYRGGHTMVDGIAVAADANGIDRLWLLARRTINGETVRTVEVLADDWRSGRNLQDEMVFVDAARILDNWNADTGKTVKMTGADLTRGAVVNLTAAGHTPFTGMEGAELRLRHVTRPMRATDAPGDAAMRILTVSGGGASATAELLRDAAANHADLDLTAWAWASAVVDGLGHLEGETVRIQGDGMDLGTAVVEDGAITLPEPVAKAVVGLPQTFRVTTLPIAAAAGGAGSIGLAMQGNQVSVGFVDGLEASVRAVVNGRAREAERVANRLEEDLIGDAPRVRNGIEHVCVECGAGTRLQVQVEADNVLPFTLAFLAMQVEVYA